MADILEFKYTLTDSFYIMVVKQRDRKFVFFGDILTRVHCTGQCDVCLTGFYKLGYKRNDVVVECETSCSGRHGRGKEEVGGWVFNSQCCCKFDAFLLLIEQLEQITKPLLNHVSMDFCRDTHYAAFNHKDAWCMMSSIFKGCIMKLIIACSVSMQTSMIFSCFSCLIFLCQFLMTDVCPSMVPDVILWVAENDVFGFYRKICFCIIMVQVVDNYINGNFIPPGSKEYMEVRNPSDGALIGQVGLSNEKDVGNAVQAASTAFSQVWSGMTMKARVAIMLRFHALVNQHAEELAKLIVMENGKNMTEALADVAKGNETVEYACSLPQVAQGKCLQVSGQVSCQDRRVPLGVVASIVPFNFPCMVPMWTLPIALVLGNTVILKPSEKVPLTMHRVAGLMKEAGMPDGVFNMVQGTKEAVQAIMAHQDVKAVTFVGSSPVAKIVSTTCRSLHKRCTSLGGAKNHLVALLGDCEVDGAAADICVSFAGCAGQRCMAASVLLLVGGIENQQREQDLLDKLIQKASAIQPGTGPGQMGPVIDDASYDKILSYIQLAVEKDGAKLLLDGRSWKRRKDDNGSGSGGNWIGPTILLHASPSDKTMREEVFGPVLSVYKCSSWEEAIEIENDNPFGNAASIYTTNGAHADWFLTKFRAAMLGVNIGIPGMKEHKFAGTVLLFCLWIIVVPLNTWFLRQLLRC